MVLIYTCFLYKQHFYKQRQPETVKNQVKVRQQPEADLLLSENSSLSSSTLSSKKSRRCSKKCTKSNRSSHRRCFVRKGALRNFAKFTRKHLCQSLFFNKVTGLTLQLFKKTPVNNAKFIRTPILQNTSRRLLLKQVRQFKDTLKAYIC